jgi:signal transduction histidine kinase/ActR/RegA family two-component response regulator
MILMLACATAEAAEPPRVIDGVIDLTHWSFADHGPVQLSGDYGFYWQRFLAPDDLAPAVDGYAPVPGTWGGTVINGHKIPGQGYATYRARVRLPAIQQMTLKFIDMGTSSRIFIDGMQIAEAGHPGTSDETAAPGSDPGSIRFTPERDEFLLTLHVANFNFRDGGPWEEIILGLPEQITELNRNRAYFLWFLSGVLFMFGIYNIAMSILQRKGSSGFFLGLLCLDLFVRGVVTSERFLVQLVPELNWEVLMKVDYLTFYVGVPLFAIFIRGVFPREFGSNAYRLAIIVGFLMCGFVIVTPAILYSHSLMPYQVFTGLFIAYGLFSVVRAIHNQQEGAWLVLMGYATLAVAVVNDILDTQNIINTGYVYHLGAIGFVFFHTFLISFRITKVYQTVEAQHESLEVSHEELKQQIEERVQAEENSRKLQDQLERARKMESLGLLAGGVAHDLNNILSATIGYPELILLKLKKDDPIRPQIEKIHRAGIQAAEVVQDLLTLARRGVDKQSVINLNDVVRDHINSPVHQTMLEEHANIELQTELHEPLPDILGADVPLKKLVMNLILNAAEAQPDKGLICISTHKLHVDQPLLLHETVDPGHYVVLSVEDAGGGIPKEQIAQIFEPFYSLKPLGHSGTGLGMTVVWGVVHDHHGFINVDTSKHGGCKIDCYFPETHLKADNPVRENGAIAEPAGAHILVVDDLPEQRELASERLRYLGYEVTTCPDGKTAVELVRQQHFDLMMLDMIMDRDMDGLDTYEAIRQIAPSLKVIIASGYTNTERLNKALELGVIDHLRKPYGLEQLSQIIHDALHETG